MAVRLEYHLHLGHGPQQGNGLGQPCGHSGLQLYVIVFMDTVERDQSFRSQLERGKTIELPPSGIADIREQRFSCLHHIVAILRPVGEHDHLEVFVIGQSGGCLAEHTVIPVIASFRHHETFRLKTGDELIVRGEEIYPVVVVFYVYVVFIGFADRIAFTGLRAFCRHSETDAESCFWIGYAEGLRVMAARGTPQHKEHHSSRDDMSYHILHLHSSYYNALLCSTTFQELT